MKYSANESCGAIIARRELHAMVVTCKHSLLTSLSIYQAIIGASRVGTWTTGCTQCTVVYLHPMHAPKGLACRERVAAAMIARLPPPASKVRRSRHLRDTLAAAPGLLAHASVTETVAFCPMGPQLRHTVGADTHRILRWCPVV